MSSKTILRSLASPVRTLISNRHLRPILPSTHTQTATPASIYISHYLLPHTSLPNPPSIAYGFDHSAASHSVLMEVAGGRRNFASSRKKIDEEDIYEDDDDDDDEMEYSISDDDDEDEDDYGSEDDVDDEDDGRRSSR